MLDHVDQMNSAAAVGFAASRHSLSGCAPKPRGCPWKGAEGDVAYRVPLGWCLRLILSASCDWGHNKLSLCRYWLSQE